MNENARRELLTALEQFHAVEADDTALRIRHFILAEEHWWARTNTRGHITASAWIVSPDRMATVLVHHRKLNRWLQPGGHIESDASVHAAALREAREESGLKTLSPIGDTIFDLDIHTIPARNDFPAHEHLDVRFLFEAERDEVPDCSAESHAVQWWSLDDLSAALTDDSVLRMVRKTRGAR